MAEMLLILDLNQKRATIQQQEIKNGFLCRQGVPNLVLVELIVNYNCPGFLK